MIHYITEDASDSPFVKLFNAAYSPDKPLESAGSNIGIVAKVREILRRDPEAYFVIYLDLTPDNTETLIVYDRLVRASLSGIHIAVFPIVCAEYAFICSVVGISGPIYSSDGLQEILTKSPNYASSALAKAYGDKGHKSFEKFCKLFCKYCLNSECCVVRSNKDAIGKNYFKDDCSCATCSTRLTLQEKSLLLCSSHVRYNWSSIFELGRCRTEKLGLN